MSALQQMNGVRESRVAVCALHAPLQRSLGRRSSNPALRKACTAASAPRPTRRQLRRQNVASAATEETTAESSTTKAHWYACVAFAESLLHDPQNEQFAEQLRERKRYFGEKGKELDFWIVSEPAWLEAKFADQAKKVRRPCVALISTDKVWIDFMKLRLDRVLKLDLGDMTQEEAFKSLAPIPDFPPFPKESWTAPYPPYSPGWWNVFLPST